MDAWTSLDICKPFYGSRTSSEPRLEPGDLEILKTKVPRGVVVKHLKLRAFYSSWDCLLPF